MRRARARPPDLQELGLARDGAPDSPNLESAPWRARRAPCGRGLAAREVARGASSEPRGPCPERSRGLARRPERPQKTVLAVREATRARTGRAPSPELLRSTGSHQALAERIDPRAPRATSDHAQRHSGQPAARPR